MVVGGLVTQSCPTLKPPWIVARQAPLRMGFSRQEYWRGLPFPAPGDLPDPEIQAAFCVSCIGRLIITESPGKPIKTYPSPRKMSLYSFVWYGYLESILLTYFKEYDTILSTLFTMLYPWRRKWQSTTVFLLENSMDRGTWQATVHGLQELDTT